MYSCGQHATGMTTILRVRTCVLLVVFWATVTNPTSLTTQIITFTYDLFQVTLETPFHGDF